MWIRCACTFVHSGQRPAARPAARLRGRIQFGARACREAMGCRPGRAVVQGCRKRGKPVIVATNMLESMIENPAPTRAEVSDISIAVREGTDAVMLSGETAYGEHPLKSMQTMSIVAKRTEFRCVSWHSTPAAQGCWICAIPSEWLL